MISTSARHALDSKEPISILRGLDWEQTFMGTVNTAKADDWSQSFDAWLKETLNQTNANSDSRLPLGPTCNMVDRYRILPG